MRALSSQEVKSLTGMLILLIVVAGLASYEFGVRQGTKNGTTSTTTWTDFVTEGTFSIQTVTEYKTTSISGSVTTLLPNCPTCTTTITETTTTTTQTIAFIFTNDTVNQINQSINLKCKAISSPNVDYYLDQIPGMNGLTLLFAKSFITKYVSFWSCI